MEQQFLDEEESEEPPKKPEQISDSGDSEPDDKKEKCECLDDNLGGRNTLCKPFC